MVKNEGCRLEHSDHENWTITMIRAVRFEQAIRASSSLPLVLRGDDGHAYFVKMKASGDGLIASVIEWLACKLGRLLDLPTLEPFALHIADDFSPGDIDAEIADLLRASTGVNFATRYYTGAVPLQKPHFAQVDRQLAARIFLFDLFLLNIDRTPDNSNFIVCNDALYCIDFAASLLLRQAIAGGHNDGLGQLRQVKRHPFYAHQLAPFDFIRQLQSLPDKQIIGLVNSVPEVWLSEIGISELLRMRIADHLLAAKNNAHVLRDKLDLLRVLVVETDAQRAQKAAKHRSRFEGKFGKL